MPLYEYRCQSCGNRYEKIQKMDDAPDTVCPKCGGVVERPLNAPAFQFKGSGWYITDYAKSGGSKPASSSSSSSEASGDVSASASEAKPGATESKPAASEAKPASSSSTTTT